MERRPTLRVEIHTAYDCRVSGSHAFSVLEEITLRKPVWVSRLKCFSASETTAANIISLAESRGWSVEITGPRQVRAERAEQLSHADSVAEVTPTFEGLF